MQNKGCNVTSLLASFPSGLTLVWDRFSARIEREREIMRVGLARRAAHRKNFCVLQDLSAAELAELGVSAREVDANINR
jgi:hypothetical protein